MWREEIRARVRRDAEEAERRLALVDSASWRARLEAVKAQMEDSSLKVELAEQEMRRAVNTMREEQQRTGGVASSRQRSMGEMQELIHGLREEQQQAQHALLASASSLRRARGTVVLHTVHACDRLRAVRAWVAWVRAVYATSEEEQRSAHRSDRDAIAVARREAEELRQQIQAGRAELEQSSAHEQSLQARVLELQRQYAGVSVPRSVGRPDCG